MKYDYLQPSHQNFPPMVHVETTNICNIKCIHCPQADPYNLVPDYKPQNMKFEAWKKVVDEVSKYDTTLRLTPDGEPLVPKDWRKQVEYVLEKGVKTFSFNTNGLLLCDDKLDVLLQKCDTKIAIEFSLDALWAESYNNIRVGSNYQKVLSNLFYLIDQRERRNLDNLRILVSCVDQPELQDGENEAFHKFWTPLVDKVIYRKYLDTKGLTPAKAVENIPDEKRWPCLVLFTRLVVTYDGKIRFCPDDWQKATTIGHINEHTLAELWQGEELSRIRQAHLDRQFKSSHPTCIECTDWEGIKWGFDYNKALQDLFS